MSCDFASYTEASVNALKFNPKSQEVIDRKQEILKSVAQHHKSVPTNILFYGFSPLMLASSCQQLSITHINDEIKNYLDSIGIKYTYIDAKDLARQSKSFSWVIASDEYFTFANDEDEQKNKVENLTNLAKNVVLTTLRDYKNQDFRDREFSQPLAVRKGNDSKIFLEYHDYDYNDKNNWKTTVYEMQGVDAKTYGVFARRSMFFKQLAKFSIDAGAKDFYIHKNLMYKSLIKKNYEHVISLSF
jgi:hypothetical protein